MIPAQVRMSLQISFSLVGVGDIDCACRIHSSGADVGGGVNYFLDRVVITLLMLEGM